MGRESRQATPEPERIKVVRTGQVILGVCRIGQSRSGHLTTSKRNVHSHWVSQGDNVRHSGPSHNMHLRMQIIKGRTPLCAMSKEKYHLAACPIFLGLGTTARLEGARRFSVCFVCLSESRRGAECNDKTRCDVVGYGGQIHRLPHTISRRSHPSADRALDGY